MAKEPVPGRVKTRLTPPLRPEQAAAVAAAALADTLAAVAAVAARPEFADLRPVLVLDGTPGPWLPAVGGWPTLAVAPQAPGPFDARLAAAFDVAHDAGDSPGGAEPAPALLIGMDTPQLSADLLAAACNALRCTDAVFGPAADGGWWALGIARPDGALLRGVPTSRPDTGARQWARLADAGLAVTGLPTLRDVDTIADAEAVARLVPGSRFAAALRSAGDRQHVPGACPTTAW
ncbi:TIGR04282 family arsenosugar biosynthesis glycosyltransferase [Frankia gtarii]|uniref:TIGR04282 family arsenosugar biosynthesis glycosyltransferase n=1 Tax=Frankia gtarii TaxID=2950102 RepID=UPI0022286E29